MLRTILTLFLTTTLIVSSGQVLEKFEFSDCMVECIGDSTRVDNVTQANGLTKIDLTAYANCIGNLEGHINMVNDTLDLIYSPKGKRIKKRNGETVEVLKITSCGCIFKFSYAISGLQKFDISRIKINGETLARINQREIREEIEITYDVDTTWSSNEIFLITEETAQFPGGVAKFKEYIADNQVLPKRGISGKVFVEFVINADGSIDDSTITVRQGLNDYCDQEALRLMKECPDWTPGRIKGQPVKQKMLLPITFSTSKKATR